MGKSNRIKANHAQEKLARPVKYKQAKKKKGLPLWLKTLIAAVVAAIVLGVCVFGILSSNGVIGRLTHPVKSENYKISSNMMSYYYTTTYQNFQSQYSDYMSYFSLDTSKSLKEQTFGDTEAGYGAETSLLGEFEGTWFDYFMNQATEGAKDVLVFCEEAKVRGITLDEADLDELDATIETLKDTAAQSNASPNAYVASVFGKGVSINDVKKAIELSMIAEKAKAAIQTEVQDGVTDADINAKYETSKLDFNVIDYSYHTFTVSYDAIAKDILGSDYTEAELAEKADEVLAKYKEEILSAKKAVSDLKACADTEAFNAYLFNYLAAKQYDTEYKKITLTDMPSVEDAAAIKAELVKQLIADLNADKETTDKAYTSKDNTYTVAGKTVTKEFAETIDKTKTTIYSSLLTSKKTYIVDKAAYASGNEFSEWAFEDGRKANDIKTIINGDGADTDDITKSTGSFTASVYIITAPSRKDTSHAKDIAYMIFSSEDKAKEAIKAFSEGEISKEAFEAVAASTGASGNSLIEDYVEGMLGVDALDAWVFDNDTVVGSYTAAPILVEEGTYLVAYYVADGEETWKITVKSAIISEEYTAATEAIVEKYPVKVNEKKLSKIGG